MLGFIHIARPTGWIKKALRCITAGTSNSILIMFKELLAIVQDWTADVFVHVICLLLYMRGEAGRLPGKFSIVLHDPNILLSKLPLEIIQEDVLAFLSVKDVVRLESLISNRAIIGALHNRIRTSELTLTTVDVDRGTGWLFRRYISPRKLVITGSAISNRILWRISTVMRSTESFVLKSEGDFSVAAVRDLLVWKCRRCLRELDLRQVEVRDEWLREFPRLSQLRVLHITLDWECTMKCLAATLDSLPLLENLGIHNCVDSFTAQQVTVLAARCTQLTSLTLAADTIDDDLETIVYSQDIVAGPLAVQFELSAMAAYLPNLQHLSLSAALSQYDLSALTLLYQHLRRLTFFHTATIPPFTWDLGKFFPAIPGESFHDLMCVNGYYEVFCAIVNGHCRELRSLRGEYHSAVARRGVSAGAGARVDSGPSLTLELRVRCWKHSRRVWPSLHEQNLDVQICWDA